VFDLNLLSGIVYGGTSGGAVADDCNECEGDGSTCSDCDGNNGQVTLLDDCNECGGNGVAAACSCTDTSGLNSDGCCDDVVPGCDDVCASGLVDDACGVCNGPGADASTDCCDNGVAGQTECQDILVDGQPFSDDIYSDSCAYYGGSSWAANYCDDEYMYDYSTGSYVYAEDVCCSCGGGENVEIPGTGQAATGPNGEAQDCNGDCGGSAVGPVAACPVPGISTFSPPPHEQQTSSA
jgi:hypothetical protein